MYSQALGGTAMASAEHRTAWDCRSNKGLYATLVKAHATVMSQYNLAVCLPRNRLRLRNTSSLIPPSSPGPWHKVSDQYCNATKMLCVN